MFDIIRSVIGYSGSRDYDSYLFAVCCVVFVTLFLETISLIKRLFSSFWR